MKITFEDGPKYDTLTQAGLEVLCCSPEARMLQSLVDEIADAADWTDRTPLHAVLHVRNLIRNLQATIATYEHESPHGGGGDRGST